MSASLPFVLSGEEIMPQAKEGCNSRGGLKEEWSRWWEEEEGEEEEENSLDLSLLKPQVFLSLIPCLVGGDEEMRGSFFFFFFTFSPSSSSLSSLQDTGTLSRFLSILDKANFISTLQHMVSPSLQHACHRAHKGHFLNIFCSSYYKIHQKLKQQSRKAVGGTRNS